MISSVSSSAMFAPNVKKQCALRHTVMLPDNDSKWFGRLRVLSVALVGSKLRKVHVLKAMGQTCVAAIGDVANHRFRYAIKQCGGFYRGVFNGRIAVRAAHRNNPRASTWRVFHT